MCMNSSAGDQASAIAAQQKADLDTGLNQVNQAFSGFTPSYYNKVQQDYTNFAQPQLMTQYASNKKQVQGDLASKGLLKSSAAQELTGGLDKELATQERGVADAGLSQAQQFQQQVEQQKNTLVNQLQASSDPLAIAQGALSQASSIQAPSLFAPVGNFFSNWSNQYAASKAADSFTQNNTLLNNALASGLAGTGSTNFAPSNNFGVIH